MEALNKVELELQELEVRAKEVVSGFQKLNDETLATVKGILEAAGVWDEVHSLELAREGEKVKAEAEMQQLRTKAAELLKVREYLKNL